jgi:hypothetical protein
MLADPAIQSLPGCLGPEERRPEYPVGRGRGDCDAAHRDEILNLKTNIYHKYKWYIFNIYQAYDIIESIYQVYTKYIPCINLSYDDLQYIPDIYLLKTFKDISESSSVPVTLRYVHSIYLV